MFWTEARGLLPWRFIHWRKLLARMLTENRRTQTNRKKYKPNPQGSLELTAGGNQENMERAEKRVGKAVSGEPVHEGTQPPTEPRCQHLATPARTLTAIAGNKSGANHIDVKISPKF